jgi:hypothetical protein
MGEILESFGENTNGEDAANLITEAKQLMAEDEKK